VARGLTVDADVGRLADVRAFVRSALLDQGVDDEAGADVVQAVDEIVTNIIQHGYAGREGKVEVELELARAGEVTVRIRDGCPPFDPRGVPTPDTRAPLADRPLGGMGVHLTRVLTDGMTHRILPSGGNELTLVKRLGASGGGEQDGDPG
jgi:serine/threonine-protein kinase RsbW